MIAAPALARAIGREGADAVAAAHPGLLLVDGTAVERTADGPEDRSAALLAALKALAELGRAGRRSVAVVGALPQADWEEHDRIGRIVVRLDIRLLVAVGHDARHLHAAAGLEGSWDGEALLVADDEEAYDVVRELLHGDEVVLVTRPGVLRRLAREAAPA
ncbi:MAG: hypothetical protein QM635_06570 [Microbacteriaceae bacterium]